MFCLTLTSLVPGLKDRSITSSSDFTYTAAGPCIWINILNGIKTPSMVFAPEIIFDFIMASYFGETLHYQLKPPNNRTHLYVCRHNSSLYDCLYFHWHLNFVIKSCPSKLHFTHPTKNRKYTLTGPNEIIIFVVLAMFKVVPPAV